MYNPTVTLQLSVMDGERGEIISSDSRTTRTGLYVSLPSSVSPFGRWFWVVFSNSSVTSTTIMYLRRNRKKEKKFISEHSIFYENSVTVFSNLSDTSTTIMSVPEKEKKIHNTILIEHSIINERIHFIFMRLSLVSAFLLMRKE